MNEGKKAYTFSAAVEKKRLLQLAEGLALHHDGLSTTLVLGTSDYKVAAGEDGLVIMDNVGGSREITAAGAFGQGVALFAAANGKVRALPVTAGSYLKVGMSLEAATADNDIVEYKPYPTPVVVTVT